MVKILERDSEEKRREERASRLVQMAREVGPDFEFNMGMSPGWIMARAEGSAALCIRPFDNRISVYSAQYFPSAVKMAKAFEKAGELEFTVEKRYS